MGGALPRPVYWTPEYILAELREGRRPSELVAQAFKDCPDGPVQASYYGELAAWRRDIPGYAEKYKEAILRCYEQREETYNGGEHGRPPHLGPVEQRCFFAALADNGGDMNAAAYDAGVKPGVVLAYLNPKSPSFDVEFARRFYDLEGERLATVYEAMFEEAFARDEKGRRNSWLLHKIAEARLPHMFNAKKLVEIEGHLQHDHQVLPAGVTRQLAHQNRALTAHEAPVIDVTAKRLPTAAEAE